MNDIIEVKAQFDEYANQISKAKNEIHDSEKSMVRIDNKLKDNRKWSGDAHDQCASALVLIKEYTVIIKDLIVELDICLNSLDSLSGQFVSGSRNVSRWKAW